VGIYKLKEAIKKFFSDLLASHQRKCECALAGMVTWRFSSHRKVMESLLMGTGYKPLQSVNYHALLQNTSIVSAGKVSLVSARQADTIYTIRKMRSF
jgi:hypothetical protein